MVTLNLAYTTAINPPDGPGPVLSEAQIWAGLQLKVRDAPAFVPAISSCTVLEDREAADGVVVREIVFASAPDKITKETCRLFGPSRVRASLVLLVSLVCAFGGPFTFLALVKSCEN